MRVTHVDERDIVPRRERARSFGPAAALYDEVRPSYPAVAIRWALAPLGSGRHRVADIGAGTGILTRVVASLGHDPAPVEPDSGMRDRLSTASPNLVVADGSAEALPFPDASIDAALAGQSYHWFDREAAHVELARTIRPGGVFAAIWNMRDHSVPWLAEYSRLIEGSLRHGLRLTDYGAEFEPVQRAVFRHTVACTPESLVRLLQSRSYYLTAGPAHRAEQETSVRELAQTHPDLAGRTTFPLPYLTEVCRAVRR
jgi:SAM-dependent methyltransferase